MRYGDCEGETVALAVFQQLTGINAVLYYSGEMLVDHGPVISKLGTALVGISQFAFGFIPMCTVDSNGPA